MAGWFLTMILGFVLEFVGLGVAAYGLLLTCRQNAGSRPFFSPRLERAVAWLRVKLGKPSRVHGGGSLSAPTAQVGTGTGFAPFVMDASLDVEAKFDALTDGINRAFEKASQALRATQVETGKRQSGDAALEEKVAQTELRVRGFSQRLIVDGVPRAIVGLLVATVGLLLQGVASVATFNWLAL